MKQFVALLLMVLLFSSQAAVGGTVSDQPFATVNGQPVSRSQFQDLMQETSAWLGDKGLQRDLAAHNFYPTSTSVAMIDWSQVSPYDRNQMAASLLELKELKTQKLELSNLAQKLQVFRAKYAALTTVLRQKATMQTVQIPKDGSTKTDGSNQSVAAGAAPGTAVSLADIAAKKQTVRKTTGGKTVVNRSRTDQWKTTRPASIEVAPPRITIGNHHVHVAPFPSFASLNLALSTRERFELELLTQIVFRRLESWAEAPYENGRAERQRLFNVYFEALVIELRHRGKNWHELQTIREELLSLRQRHTDAKTQLITKELTLMVKRHTTTLGPIQGSLARLKEAARRPLLIYQPDPYKVLPSGEIVPATEWRPGACAPSAPSLSATVPSRLRRLTLLWPAIGGLPLPSCLATSRAGPSFDPPLGGSPLSQNPAPAGFFRFKKLENPFALYHLPTIVARW